MRHSLAIILSVAALLCAVRCDAAQFIEVNAEITFDNWDYWFLADKSGNDHRGSLVPNGCNMRCVVGSNSWMMETVSGDETLTRWFTGTNIIVYTVNTNDTRGGASFPAVVDRTVRFVESQDGNPGARGATPFFGGDVGWLAYCSAACFKHEGHKIYPPSPDWMESAIYYYGWTDHAQLFKDGLGLPESVKLITTNNQTVFHYQVHETTNVLGWNFPLEFYGVQYTGGVSNGWRVELTLKGRLTSIRPVSKPEIPAEVLKAKAP